MTPGQRRRRRASLASVLALGIVIASRGATGGGATRGAGTAAMARRLQELADKVDPTRSPIANTERAALLRARLQQGGGPGDLTLEFELARELLRAGQSSAALDEVRELTAGIQGTRGPGREGLLTKALELEGIAHLRAGEQGNCLGRHNHASCLFPLSRDGVHTVTDEAEAAAQVYERLLQQDARPSWIWLLNLARMSAGQYPDGVPARWRIPPERFASERSSARFVDVATRAGVAMVGGAGGAVMEDLDGDGDLDLMASKWGLRDQIRYFRNEDNGQFTDRTEEAGLIGETGGLNLVHADYDNDGDADILVLRGGWRFDQGRLPNSLLANRGDGTFEDVTEQAGLLRFHPTQTAAWADYDGDGWLDLFVGNESTPGDAHPCELFHNRGDGTFAEVGAEVGVANVGFVKGVAWGDYDRDGRPDLYLSRFGQTNVLYRNLGPRGSSWKFTDVTAAAGVAEPLASFATWFWDFDNDGWPDLFVAPFTGFGAESLDTLVGEYLGRPADEPRPRLYRNNGDGTFKDVTRAVGLDKALAVMGANFGDFDNDGYLDLFLGTGEPSLATLVPDRMFVSDRGHRFQDVTTAAGTGHLQKAHGIAVGDVDGDGDQDLYCVMGGAYSGDVYPNALYQNPGNGNHWIVLRIRGTRENRSGIGVEIEITAASPEGDRKIFRTVGTGGSFGSSSLQEEVGLGDATAIRTLSVRWPATGRVERYERLGVDQTVVLVEGRGPLAVEGR